MVVSHNEPLLRVMHSERHNCVLFLCRLTHHTTWQGVLLLDVMNIRYCIWLDFLNDLNKPFMRHFTWFVVWFSRLQSTIRFSIPFSVKNGVFNKHPGELHNRGYLKQALIYFINHDCEAPQGAY